MENLDNEQQGPQNGWVQEVLKDEGHVSPPPDVKARATSWSKVVNDKGEVIVTM